MGSSCDATRERPGVVSRPRSERDLPDQEYDRHENHHAQHAPIGRAGDDRQLLGAAQVHQGQRVFQGVHGDDRGGGAPHHIAGVNQVVEAGIEKDAQSGGNRINFEGGIAAPTAIRADEGTNVGVEILVALQIVIVDRHEFDHDLQYFFTVIALH